MGEKYFQINISRRLSYTMYTMKYSVFMMLIIATASLFGISSVYLQVEDETQSLQYPPLPLPPPGSPPIDLPGLPPIPPPSSQQQSSGGSIVR
jgi:hypothetical protein